MTTTKLYNSFPSISFQKKSEIISFLNNHPDNPFLDRSTITHLVDYALKEISSFGGFVVTEEEDKKIIGAMVVNNTGMEGYMPNNLIVASGFLPGRQKAGIKKRILQKILYLTKGDTALMIQSPACRKSIPKNIGVKTIQLKQ